MAVVVVGRPGGKVSNMLGGSFPGKGGSEGIGAVVLGIQQRVDGGFFGGVAVHGCWEAWQVSQPRRPFQASALSTCFFSYTYSTRTFRHRRSIIPLLTPSILPRHPIPVHLNAQSC